MTEIIKITDEKDLEKLDKAALSLKEGGLVAIPTETVYGIGGNAFLSDSAKKIFEVKGRPSDNPLIVHIGDIKDAKRVGKEIPEIFYKLADKFWPGPLTMIVDKNPDIPDTVSANLQTVGIRMPDNIATRYLINKAGCPVAAPSANISGEVSATCAEFVYDDFKDKIPYIIDGGSCKVGLESTVINLTTLPPMILRPGGITFEELKEIVPEIVLHPSLKENTDVKNPASPGMKYKHYSPSCPVVLIDAPYKAAEEYIVNNIKDDEVAFPFFEQRRIAKKYGDYLLGKIDNLDEYAKNIFKFLREADNRGVKKIYLTGVKEDGIGLAIMNRLRKTAAGNIVKLKSVLFICTGNTCRSPMAEFILKAKNIKNLYVKSRGLYVCCAGKMSDKAQSVLEKYNIPYNDFHAIQVSEYDIVNSDYIYTMTNKQRESLISFFPQYKDKIKTLNDTDVMDPYMQSEEDYEKTFLEIKNGIDKIFI